MTIVFYPHEEDAHLGTLIERITILQDAAERYKAAILEDKLVAGEEAAPERRGTPHDITHAFNWSQIASILEEVRRMPEGSHTDKSKKIERLNQIAAVYEVLRGAKMPKLEAVRLALVNEAKQLGGV